MCLLSGGMRMLHETMSTFILPRTIELEEVVRKIVLPVLVGLDGVTCQSIRRLRLDDAELGDVTAYYARMARDGVGHRRSEGTYLIYVIPPSEDDPVHGDCPLLALQYIPDGLSGTGDYQDDAGTDIGTRAYFAIQSGLRSMQSDS